MAARSDDAFEMDPSWLPGLRRTLRQALRDPEAVEKLSLSHLFGETVPDFFDRFPHLKDLSIGSNQAKALPPTLRAARALEKVTFTECSFEEIDLLWDLPALQSVMALHCLQLRSIGDGIARARRLTALTLGSTSLVSLPEAIAELPALTAIGITTTFQLDLRKLWPVLAACPALETIDLRGSRLRGVPAKLARPPKLKVLHVGMYNSWRCELPDGVLDRLREVLDGVTILEGNEPLPRPVAKRPAAKKTVAGKSGAKTSATKTSATKGAATKDAATKRAPAKSAAKPAKPLAGIPITREEIEPLFGDRMPRRGYGFSCTFRSALDLAAMRDAIAPRLGELRAARKVTLHEYPPPDGPSLYVEYAGKQVGTIIKAAKGDPSRWMLSAVYRGEGTPWGSNDALFLWMVATILPWLGATDVEHPS